jgi:hypothetical protein
MLSALVAQGRLALTIAKSEIYQCGCTREALLCHSVRRILAEMQQRI